MLSDQQCEGGLRSLERGRVLQELRASQVLRVLLPHLNVVTNLIASAFSMGASLILGDWSSGRTWKEARGR